MEAGAADGRSMEYEGRGRPVDVDGRGIERSHLGPTREALTGHATPPISEQRVVEVGNRMSCSIQQLHGVMEGPIIRIPNWDGSGG